MQTTARNLCLQGAEDNSNRDKEVKKTLCVTYIRVARLQRRRMTYIGSHLSSVQATESNLRLVPKTLTKTKEATV